MNRRHFLQASSLTLGATALTAAPTEDKPVIVRMKPDLHLYNNYAWLRGFSVVPSWGARIEEAWWSYDAGRMREEIAPARLMHANCIRLWIECTAWMADPDKVTAHFMDAVAAIAEAGMKTMPTLFNRWHDGRYDYGGTYLENLSKGHQTNLDYVRALVTPLAEDDRILIWDLCNEPQSGASWAREMGPVQVKLEHDWLAEMARTVRACGARQPITIGTMSGPNIEAFADICDVLCGHPYASDRAGMQALIAALEQVQVKHQMPLLVNECMPGAENDAERGALIKITSEMLSKAGFGWMGWALREGKAISTRRDRVDRNGIRGFGFHPFALKNGRLRDGLDALTEPPPLRAPWEKA